MSESLNKIDFVIEYKGQKINKSVSIIREFSAQELDERIAEENRKRVTLERMELIKKQFNSWDGSQSNSRDYVF